MTRTSWFRDRQARRLILLGYLPWFAVLNLEQRVYSATTFQFSPAAPEVHEIADQRSRM